MNNEKVVSIVWSSWNTEITNRYNYKVNARILEEEIRFLIATNKKHGIDFLRIKNF
jgi:hypothetical protein